MTTPRRENNVLQERFRLAVDHPGAFSAGAAATGTIVCGSDASATDGDSVTVGDGIRAAVTFEYDKSSNGVSGGHTSWAAGTTAASNATALRLLILAAFPALSVADDLAGTLTITHNWIGAGGNLTITKTGTGAVSAVTGMSGGTNSTAPGTTATTTIKFHKCLRDFIVEKVEYINDTGYTADATNYFTISLKNGTTTMASWSCQTGAEGTIAAATFVAATLSATVANRAAVAGDVLSLVLTKTASAAALPPGRLVVHGRYL